MDAGQVALTLECAECEEVWEADDDEDWRAYLDDEDTLVFYCPDCADREFGAPGGHRGER